jgi:hypothetical protein
LNQETSMDYDYNERIFKKGTNLFDFLYLHRRRIFVTAGFLCCYAGVCRRLRHSKIETVRLGIAGSLTTMICDCGFHIIDTVNIRAKVAEGTVA